MIKKGLKKQVTDATENCSSFASVGISTKHTGAIAEHLLPPKTVDKNFAQRSGSKPIMP